MAEPNPNAGIGKGMWVVFWILALGTLTWVFNDVLESAFNPNQNPVSYSDRTQRVVVLDQNRYGHYVVQGEINGQSVTFLLDTGATNVAIPQHIADQLGLKYGAKHRVATANGNSIAYQTLIRRLQLGEIELNDVAASINPGIKDDAILLGMSALKRLEFSQQNKQLILREVR